MNIHQFVNFLRTTGQLWQTPPHITPNLSGPRLARRMLRQAEQGKALLIAPATGYMAKLLLGGFGHSTRLANALGVNDLNELEERVRCTLQTAPHHWNKAWSKLQSWEPIITDEQHPVYTSSANMDMIKLPSQRNHILDGGNFLTMGIVSIFDWQENRQHIGIYRIQIHNRQEATINFLPGSKGEQIVSRAQNTGNSLPIAIILGAPASYILAATTPVPHNISRLALAQWLSNNEDKLINYGPFTVPRSSQVVLLGHMPPGQTSVEAPFFNHTGAPTKPRLCPVFKFEECWSETNPLIQGVVTGKFPTETHVLGEAVEAILRPLAQHCCRSIANIYFIRAGIYHGATVIDLTPAGSIEHALDFLRQHRPWSASRLLVFTHNLSGCSNKSIFLHLLSRVRPRSINILNKQLIIDATGTYRSLLEDGSQKSLEAWQAMGVECKVPFEGMQNRLILGFSDSTVKPLELQAVHTAGPTLLLLQDRQLLNADLETMIWRAINQVSLSDDIYQSESLLIVDARNSTFP